MGLDKSIRTSIFLLQISKITASFTFHPPFSQTLLCTRLNCSQKTIRPPMIALTACLPNQPLRRPSYPTFFLTNIPEVPRSSKDSKEIHHSSVLPEQSPSLKRLHSDRD